MQSTPIPFTSQRRLMDFRLTGWMHVCTARYTRVAGISELFRSQTINLFSCRNFLVCTGVRFCNSASAELRSPICFFSSDNSLVHPFVLIFCRLPKCELTMDNIIVALSTMNARKLQLSRFHVYGFVRIHVDGACSYFRMATKWTRLSACTWIL